MTIKKRIMGLSILVLTLCLFFSSSIFAYSKSFSFNISSAIYGTTNFSLANKSTTAPTNANTYNGSGSVTSTKESYNVKLSSGWTTYSDGNDKRFRYGTVAKKTYNVDVVVPTNNNGYYVKVIGSGRVEQ